MSHAQWINRNVSFRDGRVVHLATMRREEILAEIDRLAGLDPADVPDGSRYLLEIDFSRVGDMTLERQSYWMLVMRPAPAGCGGSSDAARRCPDGSTAQTTLCCGADLSLSPDFGRRLDALWVRFPGEGAGYPPQGGRRG